MTQTYEYKGYVLIQAGYGKKDYMLINSMDEMVYKHDADHLLTESEAHALIDEFVERFEDDGK